MSAAASAPIVPVSETFVSLQGEGRLTGIPSWFIRLSGCNLRCTWCDTPYASWAPETTRRGLDELLAEAAASGTRHAVVTGGEPMMFDIVGPLTHGLRERGMHVTIETAGTIHREPTEIACDLMSLSPKLSNSAPRPGDPRDPDGVWRERHESRRRDIEPLRRLVAAWPERQFKFVVTGPDDLAEIDALLASIEGWAPEDVMLMPEGTSVPAPESVTWVVDLCVERGWRFCHRLHVELFGDTRGT